jgi:hypothetical protein
LFLAARPGLLLFPSNCSSIEPPGLDFDFPGGIKYIPACPSSPT